MERSRLRSRLQQFLADLQFLAEIHDLEVVGIGDGIPLCHVYDAKGNITDRFHAQFKPSEKHKSPTADLATLTAEIQQLHRSKERTDES